MQDSSKIVAHYVMVLLHNESARLDCHRLWFAGLIACTSLRLSKMTLATSGNIGICKHSITSVIANPMPWHAYGLGMVLSTSICSLCTCCLLLPVNDML